MKKITSDDPVLTAYVLGELGKDDEARVAAALKAEDDLERAGAEIAAVAHLLKSSLGDDRLTLGPERTAEIHRAGQRPDSKMLIMEHRKQTRRRALVAVVGVAALVMAGFALLSRSGVGPSRPVTGSDVAGSGVSGAQMTGNQSPGGTESLPGAISPTEGDQISLPLDVGRADPAVVERALVDTKSLPPQEYFKVADWINVSQVPHDSPTNEGQLGHLRVSSELGRCSWDPSKALLMIHLRPAAKEEVEFQASLQFDPAVVSEMRLVGGGAGEAKSPETIGRLSEPRTYLYELELTGNEERLGSLHLETGAKGPRQMPLTGPVRDTDEVSLSFASARALGDFARWGASPERDREVLVRLSREAKRLLGEITEEKTRYALDMILITEERLAAE